MQSKCRKYIWVFKKDLWHPLNTLAAAPLIHPFFFFFLEHPSPAIGAVSFGGQNANKDILSTGRSPPPLSSGRVLRYMPYWELSSSDCPLDSL